MEIGPRETSNPRSRQRGTYLPARDTANPPRLTQRTPAPFCQSNTGSTPRDQLRSHVPKAAPNSAKTPFWQVSSTIRGGVYSISNPLTDPLLWKFVPYERWVYNASCRKKPLPLPGVPGGSNRQRDSFAAQNSGGSERKGRRSGCGSTIGELSTCGGLIAGAGGLGAWGTGRTRGAGLALGGSSRGGRRLPGPGLPSSMRSSSASRSRAEARRSSLAPSTRAPFPFSSSIRWRVIRTCARTRALTRSV